jgi:hypothetical protein
LGIYARNSVRRIPYSEREARRDIFGGTGFLPTDSREQAIHGEVEAAPHIRSDGEQTMKAILRTILLCAATAAFMLPATAQTIHQRKVNQQRRIGNGVKSGQLTPRETAHLEHREAHLNRETRRMRAANGGKLTPREKARVNRQQNHISRSIYRQKHDAQHR